MYSQSSIVKFFFTTILVLVYNTIHNLIYIITHITARIWLASFYRFTVNDPTMSEQTSVPRMLLSAGPKDILLTL